MEQCGRQGNSQMASPGVVDLIWCEQSTESGNEYDAAIVLHKSKYINREFHNGSCNIYAAFKRIQSRPSPQSCPTASKPWVQEEAARGVGRPIRGQLSLTNQRSSLFTKTGGNWDSLQHHLVQVTVRTPRLMKW